MIQALIDKNDNFEIIRDEIAAILLAETTSQQALAIAAGKDPDLWKYRVYTERSNPWETWLNQDATADQTPLVNVWYDSTNFVEGGSNVVERQQAEGVFNIDIYAAGVSSSNGTGHNPGDKEAALNLQRALRLVRNILMASNYTYLGLRGTVGRRWIGNIQVFQPQIDARAVQNVIAARIPLQVKFNEFSPQYSGDVLELLSANILRAEDGQILFEADFDYTTI